MVTANTDAVTEEIRICLFDEINAARVKGNKRYQGWNVVLKTAYIIVEKERINPAKKTFSQVIFLFLIFIKDMYRKSGAKAIVEYLTPTERRYKTKDFIFLFCKNK